MHTRTFDAKPFAAGARPELSAAGANAVLPESGTVRFSLRSMLGWYRERVVRQRHRNELARLTDEQLVDIGLSREARDREVARSFWE
jgi:uncharacterized protein YjiS (DUF1127 family)